MFQTCSQSPYFLTMLMEHLHQLAVYGGISLTAFLIFLLSRDWHKLHKQVLTGILFHFLVLFVVYALLPGQALAISLAPLFILLLYTLGPLIYTYVEAIYHRHLQINTAFYWRMRWAFLALLGMSIIAILPINEALELWLNLGLALLGLVSLWWFTIAAYRRLIHYRKLIRDQYANTEKLELQWLSNWMKGMLLLLFADVLFGLAASVLPQLQHVLHLNVLAYSIFIVYIGYQGIQQDGVFLPASNKESIEPQTSTAPSYPNLGSNAAIKHQIEALEKLLKEKELYRQNDLSLRYLAEAMDLNEKQLSALLNQHLQTNFYEYINRYRVSAVQEAIRRGDAERYTLLAIALDCGFSSKSSFNRIFKQHSGQTPTAFKKGFDT